jgi:hypothetical protein
MDRKKNRVCPVELAGKNGRVFACDLQDGMLQKEGNNAIQRGNQYPAQKPDYQVEGHYSQKNVRRCVLSAERKYALRSLQRIFDSKARTEPR